MKIVVLDGYTLNPGDLSWSGFEALGDIIVHERTEATETIERLKGADIALTNKTRITQEVIDATSLKYIGVLATGYDVVDTEYAKIKGIPVCNVPAYGTPAVAQHTIALLLEICNHVGEHSESVKHGDWAARKDYCYWNHPITELSGKTMGIIGFGNIGQCTANIAVALGMNVLAYDLNKNLSLETSNIKYAEIDELLAVSDVISLHCPLFAETKGIINKTSISKMKKGVIILNASRGPLTVEEDLADALKSGHVYAAGVDVVSVEPINAENPLLDCPNCIITPHIAWAAKESRQRLMDIAINNIKGFLEDKPVNVVNK